MSLIDGAEFQPAKALLPAQQEVWALQWAHVAENSAFYQRLWDGVAPPTDLRDLPALPLSGTAGLRLSQAAHPPFGHCLAAPRSAATSCARTAATRRVKCDSHANSLTTRTPFSSSSM